MYLNVKVNNTINTKVAPVSIAEMRTIQKNTSANYALLIALGELQVEKIVEEGDTQIALVTTEGDTQVARVVAIGDETEDSAGGALAAEQTAESWSSQPFDEDVIQYTWNSSTDVMEDTPIPGARSAYHWEEVAKTLAAGLQFQGVWDSVACSQPSTPTPEPGELANGNFYIVGSVTGDTTGCPELSAGDWLVWSGDLDGDTTVEGSWNTINWSFDWSAITGVTVNGLATANGQDLLPTTGGTMSGVLAMGNNKITNLTYGSGDNEAVAVGQMNSANATQDTAIALNTAKVTGEDRLPLAGGAMSGQISMGNNKITNLTYGSGDNEAVAVGQMNSANATQDTAIALNTAKVTGEDRLPLAGGTMTGHIQFNNNIRLRWDTISGVSKNILYIDTADAVILGSTDLTTRLYGSAVIFHTAMPSVNAVQGTAVNHLTRKDYVDTKVAKADLIAISTGITEADTAIKTNASGKLDASMLEFQGLTFVGGWTPIAGSEATEYPDPLLFDSGSFWIFDIAYTFLTGDLTGEAYEVGDYLLLGTAGWVGLEASVDLTAYLRVDGATPMIGNLSMGVTFKVVNMADGVDAADAINKAQLDTKASISYVDSENALQDDIIAANTDKVGITTTQSDDIVTNNAKVTGANRLLADWSEFTDIFTGTPSIGVKTNTSGRIDSSFLEFDGFIYQGLFTPMTGAEYPDTAGVEYGALWKIELTADYTFVGGDLAGQVATDNNIMLWGALGWGLTEVDLDLDLVITTDGLNPPIADMDWGGYKLTNLGTGSAPTDAVTVGQMDSANTTQDTAITLNTAKVGITIVQADAIVANTAKVGVTNEVPSEPAGAGSAILNMYSLTQAEYDAITPVATTLYVITDKVDKGKATAWVNFDGTSAVSTDCVIRDSFNIGRVEHTALGHFTIHFIETMDSINYSIAGSTIGSSGPLTVITPNDSALSTDALFNIVTNTSHDGVDKDPDFVSLQIFGGKN